MDAELDKRFSQIETLVLLSAKTMLTVKDVAALTGFKVSYVRKLAEDGRLPYYKPLGKMIFFHKDEIESFLKTNRVPSMDEIIRTAKL